MQIRWLNSFGNINDLALRKILKKFVKNFFVDKNTPVKERLSKMIKSKNFESAEG